MQVEIEVFENFFQKRRFNNEINTRFTRLRMLSVTSLTTKTRVFPTTCQVELTAWVGTFHQPSSRVENSLFCLRPTFEHPVILQQLVKGDRLIAVDIHPGVEHVVSGSQEGPEV